MTLLSKTAILTANDLQTEDIEVPEWGGAVRVRLGDHFEFGGGGQVAVEPFIAGNRNSSYVTPGVRYEDSLRQEALRRFVEENPLLGAE